MNEPTCVSDETSTAIAVGTSYANSDDGSTVTATGGSDSILDKLQVADRAQAALRSREAGFGG